MKKILIVEDEESVRNLIVKRAERIHQLECQVDKTGLRCVEIAENFQPNIILLDMSLPDLNGFDLILALKANEKTQHIPIIVHSAYNHKDIIENALDLGASSYYSKGSSMQDLFETIMKYAA